MIMNELFGSGSLSSAQFSLEIVLFYSILSLILGLWIRFLYCTFGHTFSNRESLGNLFGLLTFTTFIVIGIVKSSLALSLGLVGALSIVRFRAAIKEPEELVFLFLSIAIGLALGADQWKLALFAGGFALVILLARERFWKTKTRGNVIVTFEGEQSALFEKEKNILDSIKPYVRALDVERATFEQGSMQLRLRLHLRAPDVYETLVREIHAQFPTARVSFTEPNIFFP